MPETASLYRRPLPANPAICGKGDSTPRPARPRRCVSQAGWMDADESGAGGVAALDEHGRPEPPLVADESTMLIAYLDYHRATFGWKCRDLGSEGLSTRTAASTMMLGEMMEHLALVEDGWFSRSLFGHAYSRPWDAVARSRQRVAEALADGGLDRLAVRTWPDGRAPSLRWVIQHMIEESCRHRPGARPDRRAHLAECR